MAKGRLKKQSPRAAPVSGQAELALGTVANHAHWAGHQLNLIASNLRHETRPGYSLSTEGHLRDLEVIITTLDNWKQGLDHVPCPATHFHSASNRFFQLVQVLKSRVDMHLRHDHDVPMTVEVARPCLTELGEQFLSLHRELIEQGGSNDGQE